MKFDHIDINEIRKYRKKGVTLREIGKRLNIPGDSVAYICRLNNIKYDIDRKGRKRCVICDQLTDRKEMHSNNRGLFCKECWDKRDDVNG